MRRYALALMAPLLVAGCSDSTGGTADGRVQIRFGVANGPAALKAVDGVQAAATGGPLVVTGSNGTLSITAMNVIVSRFKLKGVHDQPCATPTDSREGEDEAGECEFEAGPFFLDVPLDGSQLTVATGDIPPGTYEQMRFKVKNLDFRDDDDHEDDDNAGQAATAALFTQIRAQFPDWPARASLRVTGTFTPTGGAARPFTAYLKAESQVRLAISPPLVVSEGTATNSVAVTLAPGQFFRSGTAVLDLSQFSASNVGELDVESHGGFHGEGHSGHD